MKEVMRFGRIWVTADSRADEWFQEHLFIAHGGKQRFALKLHRLVPDERLELPTDAHALPEEARFYDVRRAASVVEASWPLEWILVGDYAGTVRQRSLVFFFRHGEETPYVVVKVRPRDAEGEALARERDALESLRGASFDATVPSVAAYRADGEGELLALSVVDGKSMYRTMINSIAPEKHVQRHFDLAAQWLVDFQRGSRGAHGDFWARNILVDGARVSVVDWEHYDASGDPLGDVFHFPLTYVLNVRRRENRPAYSFRHGFAEESVVSRAVRKWFARFGVTHSLSAAEMHERFIEHLRSAAESGRARPALDREDWWRIEEIAREEQCVFSG